MSKTLEKAQEHLDYWKKVKSGEIKNQMGATEEALNAMIEHLEEKVKLLNTTFNLKKV